MSGCFAEKSRLSAVFLILIVFLMVFSGCDYMSAEIENLSSKSPLPTEVLEQPEDGNDEITNSDAEDEPVDEPIKLILLVNPDYVGECKLLETQLGSKFFTTTKIEPSTPEEYSVLLDQKNYDITVTDYMPDLETSEYIITDFLALFDGGFATSMADDNESYVIENAYAVPLYIGREKNHIAADISAEGLTANSAAFKLSKLTYTDAEQNDKTPLYAALTGFNGLDTFDPLFCGENETIIDNLYIKLVNIGRNGEPDFNGALALASAKSGLDYYFILRDDVNFSLQSKAHPIDSNIRIGAEDVIASFERIKQQSPDGSVIKALASNLENVTLVTDISELDLITDEISGYLLRTAFNSALDVKLNKLCVTKTETNNKLGAYQLVKISLKAPLDGFYTYLAHASAGIVSAKQLDDYGSGSFMGSTLVEGGGYDNRIMASGEYSPVMSNKNYLLLEKNPSFGSKEEIGGRIKSVAFLYDNKDGFIDNRSDGKSIGLILNTTGEYEGYNSFNGRGKLVYAAFSMTGISSDENLRKTVLNAVSQSGFLELVPGADKAYSALSIIGAASVTFEPSGHAYEENLELFLSKQRNSEGE